MTHIIASDLEGTDGEKSDVQSSQTSDTPRWPLDGS